ELFMEELDFDEIAIGSHQVYKYNHSGFEYPYLYYFIPRSESQDKYLEIQVTPDPEWPIDNGDLMLEKLNSIITSLKFIDY
ncbi:MAG: hypothetical protein JXB49_05745, partial [Bacteroidales bacterium]|nr:hypothetical protein [Bacteroidales bacterium]